MQKWPYDVVMVLAYGLGVFANWWRVDAGGVMVASVFGYQDAGTHGWSDPVIIGATALFFLCSATMFLGHWRPVLFPVGALAVLAATVLLAFLHMTFSHDARADTGSIGIGPLLVGVAALSAIARQRLEGRDASEMRWRRNQMLAVMAGIVGLLAMQAVPLFVTDVTLDTQHMYDGWDATAPTQVDRLSSMVWGRTLDGPLDAGFHPWWDGHYLNKSGNGGLYAAGVTSVLAVVAGVVTTRVRHWSALATAAGLAFLVPALTWAGTVGELGTREYLSHGMVVPAWGFVVPVLSGTSFLLAARLKRVEMFAMPALPEPDRNP